MSEALTDLANGLAIEALQEIGRSFTVHTTLDMARPASLEGFRLFGRSLELAYRKGLAKTLTTASLPDVAVPEPAGWLQYIDGVKTQNFARNQSELDDVKMMFRVMKHPGKAEYVPVYLAAQPAEGSAQVATWQQRIEAQLSRTAPHAGERAAAMEDEITELRAELAKRAALVVKTFDLVDCGTCGCQVSVPVDYVEHTIPAAVVSPSEVSPVGVRAAPADTYAVCMLVAEAAHRAATGGKAMPADDVRAIVNEVLGATPAAEGATPAGDAHEVIYQIQQPGTEGWSPMNEARIPEFLAHGWKVRVARIRYERIDGDKQGAQGGGK